MYQQIHLKRKVTEKSTLLTFDIDLQKFVLGKYIPRIYQAGEASGGFSFFKQKTQFLVALSLCLSFQQKSTWRTPCLLD